MDGYFRFKVESAVEYGAYRHKIVRKYAAGSNVVLNNLMSCEILLHFIDPLSAPVSVHGDRSGLMVFTDPNVGPSILLLQSNLQGFDNGTIVTNVPHDDCILYKKAEPDYFDFYVWRGKSREADEMYRLLVRGELEPEIKRFILNTDGKFYGVGLAYSFYLTNTFQ